MSSHDGNEESEILKATFGGRSLLSINQTEHSLLKNFIKSPETNQSLALDQEQEQ